MQVLDLESQNVKALYRRAQAYIQLADLDLAEFDIKKALEIDPDNRYLSISDWTSSNYLCFYFNFNFNFYLGDFKFFQVSVYHVTASCFSLN